MLFKKRNTWALDLPREMADTLIQLCRALDIEIEDLGPGLEVCTVKVVLPEQKMLRLAAQFNVRPYKHA